MARRKQEIKLIKSPRKQKTYEFENLTRYEVTTIADLLRYMHEAFERREYCVKYAENGTVVQPRSRQHIMNNNKNLNQFQDKNEKLKEKDRKLGCSVSHCLVIMKLTYKNSINKLKKKCVFSFIDCAAYPRLKEQFGNKYESNDYDSLRKSFIELGNVLTAINTGSPSQSNWKEWPLTQSLYPIIKPKQGNPQLLFVLNCREAIFLREQTMATLRFANLPMIDPMLLLMIENNRRRIKKLNTLLHKEKEKNQNPKSVNVPGLSVNDSNKSNKSKNSNGNGNGNGLKDVNSNTTNMDKNGKNTKTNESLSIQRITRLQSRLEQLTSDKEKLSEKYNNIKSEYNILTLKYVELTNSFNEHKNMENLLRQDLKDVTKRYNDLKKQESERKNLINDNILSQIHGFGNTFHQHLKSFRAKSMRIDVSDLTSLDGKVDIKKHSNSKRRNKNSHDNQQLEAQDPDSDLESLDQETNTWINTVSKHIETLESLRADFERKYRNVKKENSNLQDKCDNYESTVDLLSKQLTKYKSTMIEKKMYNETVAQLNGIIDDRNNDIQNYIKEMELLNNSNDNELKQWKEQQGIYQTHIKDLETQIEELKKTTNNSNSNSSSNSNSNSGDDDENENDNNNGNDYDSIPQSHRRHLSSFDDSDLPNDHATSPTSPNKMMDGSYYARDDYIHNPNNVCVCLFFCLFCVGNWDLWALTAWFDPFAIVSACGS